MITVIKRNPPGEAKAQYQGEVVERSPQQVVIHARWTMPAKDLGYTRFEVGDHFVEYYYPDRWFNIFDISTQDGIRKGWYCNVAQPAVILDERIEQVDLFLDVWVDSRGEILVLDEEEFNDDTTLNEQQRTGARAGLRDLLRMIAERQGPFTALIAADE